MSDENSENENQGQDRPWSTGDPISQSDKEKVRDLIYGGFSRRRAAQILNLHKDLVGEVFDEYAPRKHPKMSEGMKSKLRKLIDSGACLEEIAAAFEVSGSTARTYAQAIGVHPRTLTSRYLSEQKHQKGKPSSE